MKECKHLNLVLLEEIPNRLRCKHCHLTISRKELGDSYCPECFEADGKRRYDFEEVASETQGQTRYRCEDCGALIKAEQ